MRADGAILFTSDGWGNSDVDDHTNFYVEELGERWESWDVCLTEEPWHFRVENEYLAKIILCRYQQEPTQKA